MKAFWYGMAQGFFWGAVVGLALVWEAYPPARLFALVLAASAGLVSFAAYCVRHWNR